MEKIVKTYVRKIYSGSYNEIMEAEVDSRDPAKIENDGLMLGFCFYDKLFILDNGRIVYEEKFNRSKFIYFGERLSLEDIKTRYINDPKYGKLDSLIRQMERSGNEFACYTNGGCIVIMRKGEMTYDEIVAKKKEKLKRLEQPLNQRKTNN